MFFLNSVTIAIPSLEASALYARIEAEEAAGQDDPSFEGYLREIASQNRLARILRADRACRSC
jgi:hypothetical protein